MGRGEAQLPGLVIDTLHKPGGAESIAVALERQVIVEQQAPVFTRHWAAPPVAIDPPVIEDASHRLPSRRGLEMRRIAVAIQAHANRAGRCQQLRHAGFQRMR